MTWHLCIDETGEFEFLLKKNSTSRIVGCLCDQNQTGRIRKELKPVLDRHGIDHNHFCEIRDGQRRERLVDELLTCLPGWTRAVVRTTGAKFFSIHPQQAYSVCLVALILGTIEHNGDLLRGHELRVSIAQRSGVITETQESSRKEFNSAFAEAVRSQVERIAARSSITVTVTVGSAFRDPELILADMVTGLTNSAHARLSETVPLQDINVHAYFSVVFGQEAGDLLTLAIEGKKWVEAFALLVDTCQQMDIARWTGLAQTIIPKVVAGDAGDIVSDGLDRIGTVLLDLRGAGMQAMESLFTLCRTVLACAGIHPRTRERALYYAVHAAAHSGRIEEGKTYVARYMELLRTHGPALFPDQFERFRRLIDIRLVAVQALWFNQLDFSAVEPALANDLALFRSLRAPLLEAGLGATDDLYARLLGTVGQSHAFAAAMTDDPDMLDLAQLEIEEDLSLLPPGDPFIAQGLSFLHSLLWWRRDLEGARRVLARILDVTEGLDAMLDEAIRPLAGSSDKGFVLLDWLRFAALRQALTGVRPSDGILEILASNPAMTTGYPWNLVAKWTAWLFHATGQLRPAHALMTSVLATNADTTPLGIMLQTVLEGWDALNRGKNPLEGTYLTNLEHCAGFGPAFAACIQLRKRVWVAPVDPFEAARFLPYYFS